MHTLSFAVVGAPWQVPEVNKKRAKMVKGRNFCCCNDGQHHCRVSRVLEKKDEGGDCVLGKKLRWVDTPIALHEGGKKAVAELPKKMSNRCKAVLKNIICLSESKEDDPSDLLAKWASVTRPKRADWLLVIKHLKKLEHPLLFKVMEYAFLEESFEANIHDYTKLIDAYSDRNCIREAELTLERMKRGGFHCDSVVLTVLIHMYSKSGSLARAIEVFNEMRLQSPTLDRRGYGAMIMAYIRAGKTELGECLMKEMESVQAFPGKEVYKALLRSYSKDGDCCGAQRVFDAIQFAGIVPDIKIIALLVNAYCVAGQVNKAGVVLKNLKKAGLRPNDLCVSVMLDAYEKENNLNKAIGFLTELENNGIEIGPESVASLVQWITRLHGSKGLDICEEICAR